MDTLIGALVIVLAVMVPPQPGIGREALASSSDMPLGWSYSPSTYTQRIPIVALAFVGLFISRYLRSEEHTSELQSLMRISYAVFCLKKKKISKIITMNM